MSYNVEMWLCLGQDTVVKYMTDGCLLREILADPLLSQYSVVLLDEVHERSLNTVSPHMIDAPYCWVHTYFSSFCQSFSAHIEWVDLLQDILLGLLKKIFSNPAEASEGRPLPLKVVVMSATLETDKLSAFLGDCPVFTIPGRTFPVTCTFGSAVGPKDTESTGYIKEVQSFSFVSDV